MTMILTTKGKTMKIKPNSKKLSKTPPNEKPLSLYPLSVEDALRAFMQVDPKRVEDKLRKEQKERKG